MSLDLKRMRKSARRVAKFLEKNPKTPGSDAIHELRTGVRSLETTFVALGLDGRRVKRLLPDLDEIRKITGEVRDMDVLTEHAATVEPRGEEDCLVRLLEHLGARRTKSAKKLRRLIRATRPRLRRDVKRSFRDAERLIRRSKNDRGHDNAVAAATSTALRFSMELRRPGRLTKDNLHEYRLKLKEFRDVLRLSDRPVSAALMKHLGEVKDSIGDWHDWVELVAIAEPLNDHGVSCKLTKRLRMTRDSKYKHALSLAHGFARRYLEPKPPKRRTGRAKDRSTPALQAVSAIAEPRA
jgi:CHAD domain-containing protein